VLPARLGPTEVLHKPLHERSLSSDNHSNDSCTGFLKGQHKNCNLVMNAYASVQNDSNKRIDINTILRPLSLSNCVLYSNTIQ